MTIGEMPHIFASGFDPIPEGARRAVASWFSIDRGAHLFFSLFRVMAVPLKGNCGIDNIYCVEPEGDVFFFRLQLGSGIGITILIKFKCFCIRQARRPLNSVRWTRFPILALVTL